MGTLVQDLKYGLRMLAKNPGFATVAMLTLALGIGTNTAIFTVVNAVLLRPLPYRDPGRLAVLWTDNLRQNLHEERTSYPNFEDWRTQNRALEDMAFSSAFTVNLTGTDEAERVLAARTSGSLFPLMGVRPILGRPFSPEEERRGDRVVVISYGFWQRRFGSSKDILLKTLEIDGARAAILGVMPASFQFPTPDTELWEPLSMWSGWEGTRTKRDIPSGFVVGRLKPKVSFREAQAEMNVVGSRLAQQYPELVRNIDFFGFGVNVVPFSLYVTGKEIRVALWLLFAAVVFVLLIACTNVANLLLSRGVGRGRELAIRAALGAGRIRVARQLLTESALLYLTSGILGLLFASAGVPILVRLAPHDIPRLEEVGIDMEVFAFALGLSVLTGLLFGLAPAWKLSASDPQESIRERGRGLSASIGSHRTRGVLVVTEFALAVVLLAGAGLLIRSFLKLQAVDPGFRTEKVLTARVVLPNNVTEARQVDFYRTVLERLQAIPGVLGAGAIDNLFFSSNPDDTVIAEGHLAAPSGKSVEQVMGDGVSPGYFQTVGVPLLKGRFLSGEDSRYSPRVAIVNRTMAQRFWPGVDPIGKRFKFGYQKPTDPWISVVGLVGDMRRGDLTHEPVCEAFLPMSQDPARGMDLVVRTSSDPLQVAAAVRSEVRSLDKAAAVLNVSTLEAQLEEQTSGRRFQMLLLSLFAAIAVLLAAIGIYGVMHYSVTQRTHEIGIRMALGARQSKILLMVIRQGFVLGLAGVLAGMIGALWLTQTMSSLLYGVRPTDPVTLAGVSLLLTVVALLASYIPARRATRVDPMVALRYE